MRRTAVAAALGLVLSASAANAQVTFTLVTRENSPRAAEIPGGIVPIVDPVGRRDCNCESWRFQGTYVPPAGARFVQFWVGTSATACATLMNRQPGLSTTTCWQLPTSLIPSQLVGGTNSFNVSIPSRYLVDPINGLCVPPMGRSTTGSNYLSVLLVPPDDMSPIGAYTIPYNQDLPISPTNVVAESQENGARISWSLGTISGDGGAVTVPENVRGIYVLCFGGPVTFDAGAPRGCDASATSDVARTDAADVVDAVDADDVVSTDADDVVTSTDTGTSGTDSAVDEAGAACGVAGPPAGFDPNDDAQFERYRCSALIDRTSTFTVVQGLQNSVAYRFMVVTQDSAGNRSAVSTLSPCVTPQLVTDFWEHYTGSGGRARPGFCSVRPGALGGGALAGGVVAFGIALAAMGVRRARRRRSK